MSVKIAGEALNACSGCEISFLDMGENLLKLLENATIVHLPILMDSKYIEMPGKGIVLPEADIGLISGGIKTLDHLRVAQAMREACNIIVAFGTCALYGGIPALANAYSNEEIKACCLNGDDGEKSDGYPSEHVPDLLKTCEALDERIRVDISLPGCPPHPDHIFRVLDALVKGEPCCLPEKSVCDNCPAARQGKGLVTDLKRTLQLPVWKNDRAIAGEEPLKCFMEQGFLCMGPVTRNGCGGDHAPARCVMAGMPCRGCYGPVKEQTNQRLSMLNALVSNGINIKSLPETVSLLRFSGAHGLLRPAVHNIEE